MSPSHTIMYTLSVSSIKYSLGQANEAHYSDMCQASNWCFGTFPPNLSGRGNHVANNFRKSDVWHTPWSKSSAGHFITVITVITIMLPTNTNTDYQLFTVYYAGRVSSKIVVRYAPMLWSHSGVFDLVCWTYIRCSCVMRGFATRQLS